MGIPRFNCLPIGSLYVLKCADKKAALQILIKVCMTETPIGAGRTKLNPRLSPRVSAGYAEGPCIKIQVWVPDLHAEIYILHLLYRIKEGG
ncbi:MAG: hypothetical protein A3I44_03535 [Candidatus Sungbacteria bacterium RIFCSPLOWO2_02_FULL_51_17]|uniref:Uncharacterized protein n=1 Tax=Candidatus Sungbacteria bacterium RIFCSPHIGHO2_02_FULL_51_29 TaxID=1802273 RepID=A0A1G2KRN9_9BACT|nr:MAG: hypothetical protein A2676_01410 [Candidatus Sungbacteria bacterium RIFCSPHIGHO2_01_FULL_51_22]OHA02105.1 MAG: hypothetical protein A3C16_04815 [Candidatus Sungbacteria bacterium RIFCSPHIGHO2_02_FULL_51_29]OHA06143.1 MAG: hypothetical protein A3B29_01745 [Candidatus Sungbacteria bacterium RIFCSPLOWO2_01_FULL_51_34]OHA10461.1 MAG: hypothetical protein A3I44_03535 [Candidatus Sungbacteria bacterium RIFCSPLOWO2_02_FULL_51_17]